MTKTRWPFLSIVSLFALSPGAPRTITFEELQNATVEPTGAVTVGFGAGVGSGVESGVALLTLEFAFVFVFASPGTFFEISTDKVFAMSLLSAFVEFSICSGQSLCFQS